MKEEELLLIFSVIVEKEKTKEKVHRDSERKSTCNGCDRGKWTRVNALEKANPLWRWRILTRAAERR